MTGVKEALIIISTFTLFKGETIMNLKKHLANAELPNEQFEAALKEDAFNRRYRRVLQHALKNDNIRYCLEQGDLSLAFTVAERLSRMEHPHD